MTPMYLSRLYPAPVLLSPRTESPYSFGAEETLFLCGAFSEAALDNLCALWRGFSFTASRLRIESVRGEGYSAFLGTEPVPEPGAYYSISSSSRGAALSAVSEKALLDGFATLVQLITPVDLSAGHESFTIEALEIRDEPSMPFRGIHLCVFPETELYTLEKAIHLAGFLKFTHVVLEFWGMLRYESCPSIAWEGRAFTKDQIRPLIRLAHGYGMEVIPMLNHFGHATQSRVAIGRHVLLNQNPRLQLLFEPDGWTWCLSNPDTKALLASLRTELCELCGAGSYFHIGCDEAYSFATCPKCSARVPHELYAEYINGLTQDLAAVGRRPIMWHDELIRRDAFPEHLNVVANGQNHHTDAALDLLDRRVIIADWQYGYRTRENPTAAYFIGHGFDTLLCPWNNAENVRGLCDAARDHRAMGVLLTTWHHLPSMFASFLSFGSDIWESRPAQSAPITEAAAILRKLHASPRFEEAGWNQYEVAPAQIYF